jgi:hypothetical protein
MRRLVCLFLLVMVSSCARIMPSVKYARPQESLSYCSLLNVTVPPPAISRKAYLGVYLAPKDLDKPLPACKDSRFVEVAGIVDGSPADRAGLKEGDVILSFDGIPVCMNHEHTVSSFRTMIARQRIGSTVTLEVLRNTQEFSLTAKLTGTPMSNHREAVHEKIMGCGNVASALETSLTSQGLLPAYSKIIDGLYERSNMSHNPGMVSGAYDALQLGELTFMMRHPLASGVVAKELSRELTAPPHKGNGRLTEVVSRAASLIDIKLSPQKPPVEITFPALLRTMSETKGKIDRTLAALTPEEKKLLRESALDPWDDNRWNTIAEVTMKVDRKKLLDAFSPLLAFLTRDNLALLKKDLIKRFGDNKGPVLYEGTTPIGKVIVGGPGPNVYTEDAALILDLGGDDVYLNNAGGDRPGMPVAMVIDWGGNDRYITKDNFSQGAGLMGGGLLIDLGGNDTFLSLDGGQGAGILGLGVLYHGDGNATFNARSYSQGTGRMGIGLILNDGGDDRYICSHHGQGLGLFGGAGILIDERGNDYYQLGGLLPDFRDPQRSYVSMGQGFGKGLRAEKGIVGVPGGIGMLIDGEGNDTYVADYFAQGSSYYYGLGILDDRGGDDQYIAGRYSQGAGIHSSVGVFMDRQGSDHYYASFGVAQGMGHDYGVGFFEDGGGTDWYRGGSLVQGAATNGGLGIFEAGLQGSYLSCADKCQAYGEEKNGMGIVIDTHPAGGANVKKKNGRTDVNIGFSRGSTEEEN